MTAGNSLREKECVSRRKWTWTTLSSAVAKPAASNGRAARDGTTGSASRPAGSRRSGPRGQQASPRRSRSVPMAATAGLVRTRARPEPGPRSGGSASAMDGLVHRGLGLPSPGAGSTGASTIDRQTDTPLVVATRRHRSAQEVPSPPDHWLHSSSARLVRVHWTIEGRRASRRPHECVGLEVTSSAAQPRSRRPSLRGSGGRGSIGTIAPSDRPSWLIPAHPRADGQGHGREERQGPSEARSLAFTTNSFRSKDVALLGRQPGGLGEIPALRPRLATGLP